MLKKYFIGFSTALVLLLASPMALADEMEEEVVGEEVVMEEEVIEVTEVKGEDMILCGGGCGGYGYGGGIYYSVSTIVSMKATDILFYGNYEVSNASSKASSLQELQNMYVKIKNRLDAYGDINRTGSYTYASWEDPSKYNGTLSISIDLDKIEDATLVEDILYTEGFSPWMDVRVDNVEAESHAVSALKDMMEKKVEIYTELLGYDLGGVTGLSIYSWADGYTFDADSGMVDVSVSADVWYSPAGM